MRLHITFLSRKGEGDVEQNSSVVVIDKKSSSRVTRLKFRNTIYKFLSILLATILLSFNWLLLQYLQRMESLPQPSIMD